MAAALVAVAHAVDDQVWTLAGLSDLALRTDDRALQLALAAIADGRRTLRSAGRFLRRCAGHDVAGPRLARIGDDRSGALYCVRVSSGA